MKNLLAYQHAVKRGLSLNKPLGFSQSKKGVTPWDFSREGILLVNLHSKHNIRGTVVWNTAYLVTNAVYLDFVSWI